MPTTLADADAAIAALWPPAGAESWDAVGLIAGDPAAEVRAIHFAVDAVPETVDEALELGAQLLLTHHPLLLRGVTSVAEDRYKGVVLGRLIRGGAALIAAHTNADIVAHGTSAVLAERLGLLDTRPLEPGRAAASAHHARAACAARRRPPACHRPRGASRGRVRAAHQHRGCLRRCGRLAACEPSRCCRRRLPDQ